MKTNNSSPSTKKKVGPVSSNQDPTHSRVMVETTTTPSIHPTIDVSQFEISPTQAQEWLDNHSQGHYKLPEAQLKRYQAIVAHNPELDAVGRLAALGGRFCKMLGKAPLEKEWSKKPYTEDEIREWHQNISVLTGKPSGRLVAIDIDSYGYNKFRAKFPGKAKTFTIGHKGQPDRAKVFYLVDGPLPPNKKPKGIGLELFSTGLQVVVQGMHPDGHPYEVWNDSPIQTISSHTLDKLWHKATGSWLYPKEARKTRQAQVEPNHLSVGGNGHHQAIDWYAENVLEKECNLISEATRGDRNNRLYASAINCFEFVAASRLNGQAVRDKLLSAACAIGLDQDRAGTRGILATIESAANRVTREIQEGIRQPRYTAMPQPKPDRIPEKVKKCGEMHPKKPSDLCGMGKRYVDHHRPNHLGIEPWYCHDFRLCDTCLGRKTAAIRYGLGRAKESSETVFVHFMSEAEYRVFVRKVGKENVLRIPQPKDEVVVFHTDPEQPGRPITEEEEQLFKELAAYVAAIPEKNGARGRNISGGLGGIVQGGRKKAEDGEVLTLPIELTWVETDAMSPEEENEIYSLTWARCEQEALGMLKNPSSTIQVEKACKWLMGEFRKDLAQAGIRVVKSGTLWKDCDLNKLAIWYRRYTAYDTPQANQSIQSVGDEKIPIAA